MLGRSHALLQGPDTDPVVLADIAAAMDEGRPVVAEILVYRCDGSSFWCQVRRPVRGWGGPTPAAPQAACGVARHLLHMAASAF